MLENNSQQKFSLVQTMHWKEYLRNLEEQKQWDSAIEFMQNIIKENPNDMDAYICMNYLLMNLLGEQDYNDAKEQYYKTLAKWYFDESYSKFSDNPEYLYITAKTAVMGEWFFEIDNNNIETMIEKAKKLAPDNFVYKENDYWDLSEKDPKDPELIAYAAMVLSEDSPIEEQLKTKGRVGEYLLRIKKSWAEDVLCNAAK